MTTTTEKTVREIALENPASIAVFESLGIDYCCGGKSPLSSACQRAGVPVDRALSLLENASGSAQPAAAEAWDRQTLRELIQHIVQTHHVYVRAQTPRIAALCAKVVAKHGPAHAELTRIEELFLALGQELAAHLFKEEQILFPYVERMEQAHLAGGNAPAPACFGTVKNPIANMVAEHENAGAALAQMRTLAKQYTVPEGACPTFVELYRSLENFERDLHRHVHLENNLLFPRAVEMEAAR